MSYILYGTALIARIENVLSDAEQALSVKEVSTIITDEDTNFNNRNFRIRVRRSLNYLVSQNIAQTGEMVKNGHINSYTYTIMEKDGKRGMSFLKKMSHKTDEAKAAMMASMVKPMIPGMQAMFSAKIDSLQKPESEGGILKEGETHAGYWVSAKDGDLTFSECALSYDSTLQKMVMSKPTRTKSLLQLLSEQDGQ